MPLVDLILEPTASLGAGKIICGDRGRIKGCIKGYIKGYEGLMASYLGDRGTF